MECFVAREDRLFSALTAESGKDQMANLLQDEYAAGLPYRGMFLGL